MPKTIMTRLKGGFGVAKANERKWPLNKKVAISNPIKRDKDKPKDRDERG